MQIVVAGVRYMVFLGGFVPGVFTEREDGRMVPWIDENINPFTGDWISRTRLKGWEAGTWSSEGRMNAVASQPDSQRGIRKWFSQ